MEMQELIDIIQQGGPEHYKDLPCSAKPFYDYFRDELIVDKNLILKGGRVVVPQSLRQTYLKLIHQGHPGADRTKKSSSHSFLA